MARPEEGQPSSPRDDRFDKLVSTVAQIAQQTASIAGAVAQLRQEAQEATVTSRTAISRLAEVENSLGESLRANAQRGDELEALIDDAKAAIEGRPVRESAERRKSPDDQVWAINRYPFRFTFLYDSRRYELPARDPQDPNSGRVQMPRWLAEFARSKSLFWIYGTESEAATFGVGILDGDEAVDVAPLPAALCAEHNEMIRYTDPSIRVERIRVRHEPGTFAKPDLPGPRVGTAVAGHLGIG